MGEPTPPEEGLAWAQAELTVEDVKNQIDIAIPEDPDLFAPEGGWMPEDFGQITVAPIPYTSNSWVRPDPHWSIQGDGWLYIEVGNVRIAIPDEEEWNKLVSMGNRMWNSHRRSIVHEQDLIAQQLSDLESDASPEDS